MEASDGDMYELLCKLEERVAALEKELRILKSGKCNEGSKSRQQLIKNIPLDDYETYIEKLNAKNGNIDEILKIYDESYVIKSKKAKLHGFQKWLCNVVLSSVYDEKDAIGRRYRRQDAIGTPYCITIDEQTALDGTVTIRERDTTKQERVAIEAVEKIVSERIDMRTLLRSL
jgi:threonyl-tRNA synthetase